MTIENEDYLFSILYLLAHSAMSIIICWMWVSATFQEYLQVLYLLMDKSRQT